MLLVICFFSRTLVLSWPWSQLHSGQAYLISWFWIGWRNCFLTIWKVFYKHHNTSTSLYFFISYRTKYQVPQINYRKFSLKIIMFLNILAVIDIFWIFFILLTFKEDSKILKRRYFVMHYHYSKIVMPKYLINKVALQFYWNSSWYDYCLITFLQLMLKQCMIVSLIFFSNLIKCLRSNSISITRGPDFKAYVKYFLYLSPFGSRVCKFNWSTNSFWKFWGHYHLA